jgi:hypothetical protein
MYDFEEEEISVLALKDYPDLRLDGMGIRLIKGQESKIPLWLAELLSDENIVKISVDDNISPRALKQLVHQENESRSINTVDSLLFRRVRRYIEELRIKSTSSAYRKLTSIEGSFDTLLRTRFRKIINYATSGRLETKDRNSFAEEERWLFENLHNLFVSYRENAGVPSNEEVGE